jgi:hypothetical protein
VWFLHDGAGIEAAVVGGLLVIVAVMHTMWIYTFRTARKIAKSITKR